MSNVAKLSIGKNQYSLSSLPYVKSNNFTLTVLPNIAMKHYLSLLLFFAVFNVSAQGSIVPKTTFYGGFQHANRSFQSKMSGPVAGLRFRPSTKWALNASVSCSPLAALDNARKQTAEKLYKTKNYSATPFAADAGIYGTYNMLSSTGPVRRHKKTLVREYSAGLRAGYRYLQHTYYNSFEIEYFQQGFDPNGHPVYLSGFRLNALTGGLGYSSAKQRKTGLTQFSCYLEVMYGISRNNTRSIKDESSWKRHTDDSKDKSSFQRWGAAGGIHLEWFGQKRLGVFCAMEIAILPLPGYSYNNALYVPRGGRGIGPVMLTGAVGAAWRLKI